MTTEQLEHFKNKLGAMAEDMSIGNDVGAALLLARKHAEELQQIAEAVGMPLAPGSRVVARVRELAILGKTSPDFWDEWLTWLESSGVPRNQEDEGYRAFSAGWKAAGRHIPAND
jgi:hypothetical protein